MIKVTDTQGPASPAVPASVFDPTRPLIYAPHKPSRGAAASGYNQRQRRSVILATIRALLLEEGCEGVTVRRIAERSGHAVQTVYNLVGPRDGAITEAISEYCQHVGLMAMPDPDAPAAAVGRFDQELQSIAANPEYCRKVCQIFFSDARHIFYDFRDRQIRSLNTFLMRQKRSGIIRADVDCYDLAQQVMMFTSSLCVEWADRPFALERLQRRLQTGYSTLLYGVLSANGDRLYLALTGKS